jgi:predicted secreted protein
MAVQDGRSLRIKIADSVILLATSCSLSITGDTLETATKDSSGKWKNKVLSGLSATLSHSGLLGTDFTDLEPHWLKLVAGTEFTWEFTDAVAGHNKFSGTGFFSGLSIESPDLQNVTIELPIEVTGAVTLAEAV